MFLNSLNWLYDVIMLSGAIKVKTVQEAAALEYVIPCHFNTKQLICCLINDSDILQY